MQKIINMQNKDSYGYDILKVDYTKDKDKDIQKTFEKTIDGVCYNSLGYIKKHCSSPSGLSVNVNCVLTIDTERQKKIIQRRIEEAKGNVKLGITFVITTCKRLDLFIRTMDSFLYNCEDLYTINKWLCVDDNSSEEDRKEMKQRYGFFDFVFKEEKDKGHAKSLNMILKKIKTKYVLLFEDDWECNAPFKIYDFIEFLKQENYDQVVFHNRTDGTVYPVVRTLNGGNIHEYVYNKNNPEKRRLHPKVYKAYLEYEKEFKVEEPLDCVMKPGYHYPGFSLNPSLFDITKIKHYKIQFKEGDDMNDTFELYFAFECLKAGFKVAFAPIRIIHIGTEKSSYVLNGKGRVYD
jgi:hypothetical protein